jgi:GNAT superfamily N-acetyltransferase
MGKSDPMEPVKLIQSELEFKPLTLDKWGDLETLFSDRGAQNTCWCMYWRITRREFERNVGDGNKDCLKKIVESGRVPGILAFYKGSPVGWCSVAPREDFPVIMRSPTLKPNDDQPAWSITCFFVTRSYRNSGLTHLLIRAAVRYAKEHGARIIEAYPVDVRAKSIQDGRYSGLNTTFEKEGFSEVFRRSERKPIMRYYVKGDSTQK